jgi:nitrate/TMAO reductase-like tetraheme cytochrome c subunit
MLKSRAQINMLETKRKTQQNKNCFFEKINKFDRHLARLNKEEKKRKKETQETCCQYEKLKKGSYY